MVRIIIFLLLLAPSIVSAKTLLLNATLTRVIDGDTFIVTYHKLDLRVRLLGVDTFETRRSKHATMQEIKYNLTFDQVKSKGEAAKLYVKQFEGKPICLMLDTKRLTGFYGRYLGVVYPESCGCTLKNKDISINQLLLDKKLAVKY